MCETDRMNIDDQGTIYLHDLSESNLYGRSYGKRVSDELSLGSMTNITICMRPTQRINHTFLLGLLAIPLIRFKGKSPNEILRHVNLEQLTAKQAQVITRGIRLGYCLRPV